MVWALTIIPEAYGDSRGQMRAMLVKALAEFIKVNPEADRMRMVGVLENIDPSDMERDVRASVKINGGGTTAAMLSALERLYKNAGRGGKAA